MSSVVTRRSSRLLAHAATTSSPQTRLKSRKEISSTPVALNDGDKEIVKLKKLTKNEPKAPAKVRSSNSEVSSNSSFVKHNLEERVNKTPMKTKDEDLCPKVMTDVNEQSLFTQTKTPSKNKLRNDQSRGQVTPPKQRKINNDESCVAPPSTPSSLFKKLTLNSENDIEEISMERKIRKSLFKDNDIYQSARKALHSTYPTNMPGREKEINELKDFITSHLNAGTSWSMYISGPPGTGKTASLNVILEEKEISSKLKHVYINCTSIKSSGSVFSKISSELGAKCTGKTEKDYINAIENYFQKEHKHVLLVLDEIDQLESKRQSVLYTIFDWPSKPNSRLVLIGIANALDLTDRILPRLQTRCALRPKLMHFAPYNKDQIIQIFTSRLTDAGVLNVFSPAALQMLARKVAATSGDLRRALDIGRRVIELVDKKKNVENILQSAENIIGLLEETKKPEIVDLKQVINVLDNVYGVSQKFCDDVDDTFPLQQKIVICALILMMKSAKNKDIIIGRLHEVYKRVCLKRNIQAVDQGEFVGICSLIETRGIIKIIKKKDIKLSKVCLVWDEEEVASALRDKQLMATIIQDVDCLERLRF